MAQPRPSLGNNGQVLDMYRPWSGLTAGHHSVLERIWDENWRKDPDVMRAVEASLDELRVLLAKDIPKYGWFLTWQRRAKGELPFWGPRDSPGKWTKTEAVVNTELMRFLLTRQRSGHTHATVCSAGGCAPIPVPRSHQGSPPF